MDHGWHDCNSSHWCPCHQPDGRSPPSSYLKIRRDCSLASDSCSHLLHPSSVYRSPAFSFPSLKTLFNPWPIDLLLVHFCPPPSPLGSRQTSCLTNSKAFASEFSGCPVHCLSLWPLACECPSKLCSLLTPGLLWENIPSPWVLLTSGSETVSALPQVQASHLDLNVLFTTQTTNDPPSQTLRISAFQPGIPIYPTSSGRKSQWKLLLTSVCFTLFMFARIYHLYHVASLYHK